MSNGTPAGWAERAAQQVREAIIVKSDVQTPRRLVVSGKAPERPAVRYEELELRVPEDEPIRKRDDFLTLLLVGAILGILIALTLWTPQVFAFMREWVLG